VVSQLNDKSSIQEGIIMAKTVGAQSSSINTKTSLEERISLLEKQKAKMYNVWKTLNDKSAELSLMDDYTLLEANEKYYPT
jgi:hypothetical protein